MHRVRQDDLPFAGSSPDFVGADHGSVGISVFLLNAPPGAGPGPHRHPYVRAGSAAAFDAIDARCDALTIVEAPVGTFQPAGAVRADG